MQSLSNYPSFMCLLRYLFPLHHIVSRWHLKVFNHFVSMHVPSSQVSFQRLHACRSPISVICYCVLLPSFTEFCHPVLICLPLDDVPFWHFQNSVTLHARVFTSGGFATLSVSRPISHCAASWRFVRLATAFLQRQLQVLVQLEKMDIYEYNLIFVAIKRTWFRKCIRLCNNQITLVYF